MQKDSDMVEMRRPLRLRGRFHPPKDGVYRVTTPSRCGAFLVYNGRVHRCSPSIRRRLHVYAHRAEWICLPWEPEALSGAASPAPSEEELNELRSLRALSCFADSSGGLMV